MGSFRFVRLRSAEDRTPLNVCMPVDGAMCRLGLEVDEVVAEVRRCVWAGEWVACVWETATARYGMRPSLGCAGRQWGACERKTGERGSLLHPCPAMPREWRAPSWQNSLVMVNLFGGTAAQKRVTGGRWRRM